MSIRIATFNVENLFARYRFNEGFTPGSDGGFTTNDVAFDIYEETEKQITAVAIKEVKADVIALQEVESLPVLDAFNSRYLAGQGYRFRIVIDSFDPRKIDVAILSKHPIVSVRSYRHERNASNSAWLFSRDCLEAEIEIAGRRLTLYVNHFKSMMEGRDETHARRQEQVDRVAQLFTQRWGDANYQSNSVVLGDFNDYPQGNTALGSLLQHPGLVNVVERLPEADRWTHFYSGGNEYRQLDYILLSKGLADANPKLPGIMRQGLPFRAERYAGPRFPNVGHDNPKASDHAPLYMDINLV
jgi:endonuclease/exonuclease/phosphatase family metal-dependent hydrolase